MPDIMHDLRAALRERGDAPFLHADDPAFDERQSLLVKLCDELHDASTVSDATWSQLREHYDELQIQELVYTAGFYHTVSFMCNAFGLENEAFGATFDELRASRA